MDAADRVAELESRLAALEQKSRSADEEHLQRLWAEVKEIRDVDTLLARLRQQVEGRTPVKRAAVHGVIDGIVANGDGAIATPATTIILTSSEPCMIIVVTAITLTICD